MEEIQIPTTKEIEIQKIRFTYPSCKVLDLDKIMASYGDKDCNGSSPKKRTHFNKSKENCELIFETLQKDIQAEDERLTKELATRKADAAKVEEKRVADTLKFANLNPRQKIKAELAEEKESTTEPKPKKAKKKKSTE